MACRWSNRSRFAAKQIPTTRNISRQKKSRWATCCKRPFESSACSLPFARSRHSDRYSCEKENNRSGKQAIAAKSMQHERLHIEQPKRKREHHPNDQRKKHSRSHVTEQGESRATKNSEIRQRPQRRHRNSADPRVGAAQHFVATGRTTADNRFAGERHHA